MKLIIGASGYIGSNLYKHFSKKEEIHHKKIKNMAMHSLMFGWEYPPNHLGGLGVACQGLVRGLLKLGNHVTLVLPHGGVDTDDNLDIKFPTESRLQEMRIRSMLQPYDSPATYDARLAQQTVQNQRADVSLFPPQYFSDTPEAEHPRLAKGLLKR